MTDNNDWYRILSLARSNAANDLRTSNNILTISDALTEAFNNGEINEDQINKINEEIIKAALELADRSKEMNFAITKLMGAI